MILFLPEDYESTCDCQLNLGPARNADVSAWQLLQSRECASMV
jgi:hypothetical protein